jgi:capsular polysaccharide transport system permease protein
MKMPNFSKLFVFIVLIPGALAAVYFAFISDDVYDSQAIVTLKSISGDSKGGGITSLLGAPSMSSDSANLRQMMLSYDMLNHLESTVGLTKVWGAHSIDIIGRLWPAHPSQERLMRYFHRRVTAGFDASTDMITIQSGSFVPLHAEQITQEIVAEANRYTNDVSNSLAHLQQEAMEKETQQFYGRLVQARDRLVAYQTANGILDAEGAARAESTLVSKLQGEEAATSAELTQALTYLSPGAFGAQSLSEKLSGLRAELARQKALAVTPGTTGTRALDYRELKTDAEFLEQAYVRSEAALEQAKLDATRDAKKLVIIQSPNLPEAPRYLARLTGFGLWLLALLALFTVARLALAVHRERSQR